MIIINFHCWSLKLYSEQMLLSLYSSKLLLLCLLKMLASLTSPKFGSYPTL